MDLLRAHRSFLANHPSSVVFWSSLIEAAGIPFPSRVILILTPAFLATERDLVRLIIVATIGALLGDHVPYTRWSGGRHSDARSVLQGYHRIRSLHGKDAGILPTLRRCRPCLEPLLHKCSNLCLGTRGMWAHHLFTLFGQTA